MMGKDEIGKNLMNITNLANDVAAKVKEFENKMKAIDDERKTLADQLQFAKEVSALNSKTLDATKFAYYLGQLFELQNAYKQYSGATINDTETRLTKSTGDLKELLGAYEGLSKDGHSGYGIEEIIIIIQDIIKNIKIALDGKSHLELSNDQAFSNQEIKFGTIETPVESPFLKTPEPELKTVNFDELSTDNNSSLTSLSDNNSATLDRLSGLFNDDNSNPFDDNTITFPEVKASVTTPVNLSEEKKDDMNNTIAFSDALGDLRRMTSGEDNKESMSTVSENTGRQKVVNVVNAQDLFQSDSQEKDNTLTLGRAA